MSYQNHLYQILYPNQALVASQLGPQAFARHYLYGSVRHYHGKMLYAEIDIDFRHPYFNIEECLSRMVPHEDGSPKHTKFICSYRVMEHMDFSAIKKLYISTSEAHVLELSPKPYDTQHQPGLLRTFAEIAPLSMLVLTTLTMPDFGRYITAPGNPKGCPKLFFTQIELNADEFLQSFEKNPFMQAPFAFLHPSKLRDAILEFKVKPKKDVKGLALFAPMDQISYRMIRHGFMFASNDQNLYFPMPTSQEIEVNNFRFWQDM